MVKEVPSNYIFYLVCCLKPTCCHPICKSQSISQLPVWYTGAPTVSFVPLPIPGPTRPWGGSNCEQCKGDCHGHYLKPAEALLSTAPQMVSPASVVLREAFQNLSHYPPFEAEIEEMAKNALLTKHEVQMWQRRQNNIASGQANLAH